MSETIALLETSLQSLAPLHLHIDDDSAAHAGHAGARSGGGHYTLSIVSARFSGLSRIGRHRLIYDCLGDLMQTRVHALSINALSPDEL